MQSGRSKVHSTLWMSTGERARIVMLGNWVRKLFIYIDDIRSNVIRMVPMDVQQKMILWSQGPLLGRDYHLQRKWRFIYPRPHLVVFLR
jgi:hypothetical protein